MLCLDKKLVWDTLFGDLEYCTAIFNVAIMEGEK